VLKSNYKATLKTLIRHPAIIIACVAVVVTMLTNDYWQGGVGVEANAIHQIFNMARCSTWGWVFPPLLGITISANLLSEKNNGFSDVLSASNVAFRKYITSKILAFCTVGVVAHLAFAFVWSVNIWVVQDIALGGRTATYTFAEVVGAYLLYESIYLPLSLLVATSIAFFCISVSGYPVMGAVGLMVYPFLERIFVFLQGTPAINNIPGGILYYLPKQLDFCLRFTVDDKPWVYHQQVQAMVGIYLYWNKAIAAFIFHYVFSIIILIISCLILKKRYNLGVRAENK